MRIKILESAMDLYKGRLFYEEKDIELGEYFFNSLFSDIDSFTLFAGVHIKIFGYYRKIISEFSLCHILQNRGINHSCVESS